MNYEMGVIILSQGAVAQFLLNLIASVAGCARRAGEHGEQVAPLL